MKFKSFRLFFVIFLFMFCDDIVVTDLCCVCVCVYRLNNYFHRELITYFFNQSVYVCKIYVLICNIAKAVRCYKRKTKKNGRRL